MIAWLPCRTNWGVKDDVWEDVGGLVLVNAAYIVSLTGYRPGVTVVTIEGEKSLYTKGDPHEVVLDLALRQAVSEVRT